MPLFLSTVYSSLIAMAVMLAVLYAPRFVGRKPYDVLRALGSGLTGRLGGGSVALGAAAFTVGGLVFGYLYGLLTLAMMRSSEVIPEVTPGLTFISDVNLSYAFIGHWIGAGHGVVVSLLLTVLVIEHHPIERFRGRMGLVPLVLISHIIYGGVVMFFHHQFLQAFTG